MAARVGGGGAPLGQTPNPATKVGFHPAPLYYDKEKPLLGDL